MAPGALEMTFAERQLAKFGWKKGMGLGKNNDGISEPIKIKTSKNKLGIGNDLKKPLTHWWDMAYNRAVNNIVVERSETGQIEVRSSNECSITKEKPNLFSTNVLYDDFKQAGVLKGIQFTSDKPDAEDESHRGKVQGLLLDMSDADLLKLCGGGTAHKGARHGIRMGGKMKRIKEMEKADALSATLRRQAEQKRQHETVEKNNNLEDNDKSIGQESCGDKSSKQPCLDNGSSHDTKNPIEVYEEESSGADTNVPKKIKKKSKKDRKNDSSQIATLNNPRKDNSSELDEGIGSSLEILSDESNCKATKKKKRKRDDTDDTLVDNKETSVESSVVAPQENKKKKKRKHQDDRPDEIEASLHCFPEESFDLRKKKRKTSKCRESEIEDELDENWNAKKKNKCEYNNEATAILEIDQTSEEIRQKKKKHKKQKC